MIPLTLSFVLLNAVEDILDRVVILAACIGAAVFSDGVEKRGQDRRLLV